MNPLWFIFPTALNRSLFKMFSTVFTLMRCDFNSCPLLNLKLFRLTSQIFYFVDQVQIEVPQEADLTIVEAGTTIMAVVILIEVAIALYVNFVAKMVIQFTNAIIGLMFITQVNLLLLRTTTLHHLLNQMPS